MSYTVSSLEEMPNALSYLIKTVEEKQAQDVMTHRKSIAA